MTGTRRPPPAAVVRIRRSPQANRFVTVSNDLAQDKGLSLRARGLLVLLLSYPPDWHFTSASLAKVCPEGRDAIRKAMQELRSARYAVLEREQGRDGRWQTFTTVYDRPQPETP